VWFTVVATEGALSSASALRFAQSNTSLAPQNVQRGVSSTEIPTDWVLDRWVSNSV
jgi:hypothetical protein